MNTLFSPVVNDPILTNKVSLFCVTSPGNQLKLHGESARHALLYRRNELGIASYQQFEHDQCLPGCQKHPPSPRISKKTVTANFWMKIRRFLLRGMRRCSPQILKKTLQEIFRSCRCRMSPSTKRRPAFDIHRNNSFEELHLQFGNIIKSASTIQKSLEKRFSAFSI